jgi:hypothetical protein
MLSLKVGPWPYPQSLDYIVKAYVDKHSSLFDPFPNYKGKSF